MEIPKDRIRLMIINHALVFEHLTAKILAGSLNIDIDKSKTLGNTSAAFSFNQKLIILTDIKWLEPDAKDLIVKFASIRNQFAHNIQITSFETCFDSKSLTGAESFLISFFNAEVSNMPDFYTVAREERLERTYMLLYGKVELEMKKLADKLTLKNTVSRVDQKRKLQSEKLLQAFQELSNSNEPFKIEYLKIYDKVLNDIKK